VINVVEVRPAGAKGAGVFARRSFEAGEFVFRRRHVRVLDTAGAYRSTGTVVGSFFAMDPDRQELMHPRAPSFIQREYRRRRRSGS
jgi:hypothetical protein